MRVRRSRVTVRLTGDFNRGRSRLERTARCRPRLTEALETVRI